MPKKRRRYDPQPVMNTVNLVYTNSRRPSGQVLCPISNRMIVVRHGEPVAVPEQDVAALLKVEAYWARADKPKPAKPSADMAPPTTDVSDA